VTEAAVRRVEATGAHADETALVVVAGEDWHPGVVGIVAGRLRERWRKPVIVIGLDPVTGLGKGSGRSQPGMNLGRAIQAAWEAGVLLAGGGHAMAAGLTMDGARLAELTDFLNDRLAGERIEAVAMDALEIDALIDPGAATRALFESFEQLAPFGPSNPEPVFALNGVQAREPVQMNGGHVRCRLVGPDGASVRAVAWRCADLPTGQALLSGQGGLNVVGRLKADDWNGRRGVQFEIEGRRRSAQGLSGAGTPWTVAKNSKSALAPVRGRGYIAGSPAQRSLRLSVRTSGFQPEKRGSTPLGTATRDEYGPCR
jgi:single-stranded-DNA-specific exonuclease